MSILHFNSEERLTDIRWIPFQVFDVTNESPDEPLGETKLIVQELSPPLSNVIIDYKSLYCLKVYFRICIV